MGPLVDKIILGLFLFSFSLRNCIVHVANLTPLFNANKPTPFTCASFFIEIHEWQMLFVGNPLEEKHSAEGNWRDEAIRRLPRLKKLDGEFFRLQVVNKLTER